jgi:hypothetical protein
MYTPALLGSGPWRTNAILVPSDDHAGDQLLIAADVRAMRSVPSVRIM